MVAVLATLALTTLGTLVLSEATAQRTPTTPVRDAGRDTGTPARAIVRDAGRDASTSDATAPPRVYLSTPAAPAVNAARCPAGMVLVEGDYCPNVEQVCRRWLDPGEDPMRCAEFAPSRCVGRRRHVAVCMDKFEAPNRPGALPQVMLSWFAAKRGCEARHARLCTMAEWTFACEGEQMSPYPYGLVRDAHACNVDHQTVVPNRARLGNPMTAADESARLYEAAPSGQYPRCTSPFGVNDMTGNADEWVRNEAGVPFQSALKGGWWGPIRGRCRPATLAHNETFVYYQIGYRCCTDPQ